MTLLSWCGDPDPNTVTGALACLNRPLPFDFPPWPVLELGLTQASSPSDAFMQYGAIGAIALLALLAVRYLFQRQVQAHERDIARAERAEQQLRELNELIRESLVVQLTRATDAASRAAELLGRKEGDR